MHYLNENDPLAAAQLRELMIAGLIPQGDVDERSITEVKAEDLKGYSQCHFFAGVGGWPYALRLAGWPDDRPCWTGSCPCQPFSASGQRKGNADERHLWPAFAALIKGCRPTVVFGEQVASAEVVGTELETSFIAAVQDGNFARANKLAKRLATSKSFHFHRRWLDGVRADLEASDYAMRCGVLGAHSVGAPHIRQRLFWVADSQHGRQAEQEPRPQSGCGCGGECSCGLADASDTKRGRRPEPAGECGRAFHTANGGDARGVADADGGLTRDVGLQRGGQHGQQPQDGGVGGMGDTDGAGLQERVVLGGVRVGAGRAPTGQTIELRSPWDDYRLIECRDGKVRRIPAEPALFPLVNGPVPARMAILRGAGNAINPLVAAQFIKAVELANNGGS